MSGISSQNWRQLGAVLRAWPVSEAWPPYKPAMNLEEYAADQVKCAREESEARARDDEAILVPSPVSCTDLLQMLQSLGNEASSTPGKELIVKSHEQLKQLVQYAEDNVKIHKQGLEQGIVTKEGGEGPAESWRQGKNSIEAAESMEDAIREEYSTVYDRAENTLMNLSRAQVVFEKFATALGIELDKDKSGPAAAR